MNKDIETIEDLPAIERILVNYRNFDTTRSQAILDIESIINERVIRADEQFVITEADVQELHGNNYFFDNGLDVDYSIFLDDKRESFSVGEPNDIPFFSYQNADKLIKSRQRQALTNALYSKGE